MGKRKKKTARKLKKLAKPLIIGVGVAVVIVAAAAYFLLNGGWHKVADQVLPQEEKNEQQSEPKTELDPLGYNTRAETSVNVQEASPGEQVTWTHKGTRRDARKPHADLTMVVTTEVRNGSGSFKPVSFSLDRDVTPWVHSTSLTIPSSIRSGSEVCRKTMIEKGQFIDDTYHDVVSDVACVRIVGEPYEVTPTISVDQTLVRPGTTVTWFHGAERDGVIDARKQLQLSSETVRIGPMKKDGKVKDTKVRLHQDGNNVRESKLPRQVLLDGGDKKTPWPYRDVSFTAHSGPAKWQFTSTLTIEKDTPKGTKFCRQTKVKDAKMTKEYEYSDAATQFECVTVGETKYNLEPNVELSSGGGVYEAKSSATVAPVITNKGPHASQPTSWQLVQVFVPKDKGIGDEGEGGETDREVCKDVFNGNGRTCKVIAKGGKRAFTDINTPINLGESEADIDNKPIGSEYCFVLAVHRPTQSSKRWRYSQAQCVTLGKRPTVVVTGGDAVSASRIITGDVRRDGRLYGSWSEYGVMARGSIIGFGSMSAFRDGMGIGDYQWDAWTRLTFANQPSESGGSYAQLMPAAPAIANALKPRSDSDAEPLSETKMSLKDIVALDTTKETFRAANGPLTLTGKEAKVPKGRTIILYAEDTITIDQNITYDNNKLKTIKDLPQLIIIAKNIRITSKVTNVDAWLVADYIGGKIETCAGSPAQLTVKQCTKPLTVNGPTIAGSLYLQRTASPGVKDVRLDKPAETFNLRADAYLWAHNHSTGIDRARTVTIREAPPRF